MIDVESAVGLIAKNSLKNKKERLSLENLNGRVLAHSFYAKREQPPFDRVAMDGIAFLYKEGLNYFTLLGSQRAGEAPISIKKSSQAIEVMTGAILPLGVDTVVPYEQISIKNGNAYINDDYTTKPKSNIHFQGSDHPEGELLLPAGVKLNSTSIALIAGQGCHEATVSASPKIAIISTGDELIDPGKPCEKWQIWRSNSYGIRAELLKIGIPLNKIELFHLDDDESQIVSSLKEILAAHEILIISGGVSMGKYDFVHSAMSDIGVRKVFHKIKQRPGKPMFFGVGGNGQNVFGLPGNPISALICMRKYVTSAIEASFGRTEAMQYAVLSEEIQFKKDFSFFKHVKIFCNKEGQVLATPICSNGSGDFASLAKSDGFLELPADEEIFKKGSAYRYFSWGRD